MAICERPTTPEHADKGAELALSIVVRKAEAQDLDVVNALTDTMHKHLAGLYGLELSAEELKEEHYNEDELGNLHVAEDAEDGVIAYMSFSKGKDEWAGAHYELEHIVVREDFRHMAIGRKLFKVLLEEANREGVNIATGTLARNKEALRFYEQLGFKQISVRLLLDLQKKILKQ